MNPSSSTQTQAPQQIVSFGGGGFIGFHLTKRLLDVGHTLLVVDAEQTKIADLLGHPRLTFLHKDIRDAQCDVAALVRDADLVIDLIAHANPGSYVQRPLDVFTLNFQENLRIAEACVQARKRIIQFSSCEVYGKTVAAVAADALRDPEDPAHATFSEDSTDFILGPVVKHRWIYASAKQLLERVLHAYGRSGELNYTIVRPFNFIGPKIDFFPSERDDCPRVFSHFMEALMRGTPMKLVDGGTSRRCYTYIDDATDAVARIVENAGGLCDREIFNVGNPRNEISIRDLAYKMRGIYEARYSMPGRRRSEIVEVSARDFYGDGYEDSDRRIPDISKARRLLGWEPRFTVDQTLEASIESFVGTPPALR